MASINDTYRADIASVLATRLINHCLVFDQTNPINDAMSKRLIDLTTRKF